MANEQNLINLKNRTQRERKEIAKKGAEATNKLKAQRKTLREELIKRIQEDGDTYIDTIFQDEVPKGYDIPIYYLAKSIEAIAYADKIIFMNGWDKARGCIIEHEVAISYDKIISYYKD